MIAARHSKSNPIDYVLNPINYDLRNKFIPSSFCLLLV